MEPPHGRIVEAKLDHPSRPRRASYLLRGVCLVGGGNGTDPEIWDDGEIADRLSHAVPLFGLANRQAELMMRIASEFGFTLASRSRISAPSPDQLPLLDLTTDDYEQDESERRG